MHTNLAVSETTIYPYGIVKNENTQKATFGVMMKSMMGSGGSGSTPSEEA